MYSTTPPPIPQLAPPAKITAAKDGLHYEYSDIGKAPASTISMAEKPGKAGASSKISAADVDSLYDESSEFMNQKEETYSIPAYCHT